MRAPTHHDLVAPGVFRPLEKLQLGKGRDVEVGVAPLDAANGLADAEVLKLPRIEVREPFGQRPRVLVADAEHDARAGARIERPGYQRLRLQFGSNSGARGSNPIYRLLART